MDVLFFDVTLSGVKRYPEKIARALKARDPDVVTGAIYLMKDGDGTYSGALDNCEQVATSLEAFVERKRPKAVVIFSHRIPDLVVLATCKRLGIPTAFFQHGIFLEHMPYIGKAFFSKKAVYYLRLLPALKRATGVPWSRVRRHQSFPNEGWRADLALTFGEAWNEFFERQCGYTSDQCTIVGYPDFDDWEINSVEKGVCYIAQTAVEDNRLSRQSFEGFVQALRAVHERGSSLVVKLHPRSDESLYDPLVEAGVELIRFGDMPLRNVYIGHSSTLLAKAGRVSKNIVLWPFESIPIPDYFADMATAMCDTEEELVNHVDHLLANPGTPDKAYLEAIDRYFAKAPEGTIAATADSILRLAS